MKKIIILGSTGSIGTQALEIVTKNPHLFQVVGLTCGENVKLMAEQIREFSPDFVAVSSEEGASKLKEHLGLSEKTEANEGKIVLKAPEILVGEDGIAEVASRKADLLVNALMGMRGLVPTLKAIEKGTDIALANKETLVAGGHLVMKAVKDKGVKLLPIDSEHSAIFQCLQGNEGKKVKRILLTASGGPFRGWSYEDLKTVTPEMALKHPNWTMGKKITIDSATMMNKGLEIIEARWLFDIPAHSIDVLVHPQSIMHSGVEFEDTAVLAQLGTPDMRVPISVAMGYPDRIASGEESLDFFGKGRNLTFEEPDEKTFRCLGIAKEAIEKGMTYPAVMNGANEVLVALFLEKKIGFTDIPEIIDEVMKAHTPAVNPSLGDVISADHWARTKASEFAEARSASARI